MKLRSRSSKEKEQSSPNSRKHDARVSKSSVRVKRRRGTVAEPKKQMNRHPQLTRRQPSTTSATGWKDLPAEIRIMIWQEVAKIDTKRRRLPKLSRVCKDWQPFFESFLYASLKLNSEDDIRSFDNMMRGHRPELVKNIRLYVELEMYLHDECSVKEDETTISLNNQLFSRHLLGLFKIISGWSVCGGLTLELAASSRSDTLHLWPKYSDTAAKWHRDPSCNCPEAYYGTNASKESKQRTIGSLLDFVCPDNDDLHLPSNARISAVSRLVMSREHFRTPSSEALRYIIRMLPYLEDVVYEPWRGLGSEDNRLRGMAHATLLSELPEGVKSVSLWEANQPQMHTNDHVVKPENPGLVTAAVRISRQLETFYATCAFDAWDFFSSAGAEQSWPELKRLALTSNSFSDDTTRANRLLLSAGLAVRRMPKLEVMELWYCEGRKYFLFRYQRAAHIQRLRLENNWPMFVMASNTVKVWRENTAGLRVEGDSVWVRGLRGGTHAIMKDRLHGRVCWELEGDKGEKRKQANPCTFEIDEYFSDN